MNGIDNSNFIPDEAVNNTHGSNDNETVINQDEQTDDLRAKYERGIWGNEIEFLFSCIALSDWETFGDFPSLLLKTD